MKQVLRFPRKFFLAFLLLFQLFAQANEPTSPSSNITFDSRYVDGGQFQVNFTAGNGVGRIVVVKEGSDITGKPLDGASYTANTIYYDARFGIAGSEIATGEYVVYAGASNTVTVTNLKPGTTYYVAIFEYNGTYATPATIDYFPVTPTGKNVTTLVAPTVQAAITGFTSVNGNSLRVNLKNGNGNWRMVVARKGNTLTALPTDLVKYDNSSVFKGTTASSYYLDAESFVVYKINRQSTGATDYTDVTKLEPNTTYTFAVFEYNSSINGYTPVYLKPGFLQTVTTSAGPTKAASNIGFSSIEGNKLTLNFSYGDGARRIIVAKKGSPVTSIPVNGSHYTANAQFGSGTEMTAGSGEYVVYDGSYNSVTVTNLDLFTTYYFTVYEYDQDGNGNTYYLTTPASGSHSTALTPTANTVLSVSSVTGSSAQLKYTFPATGYGAYRLLVIKEGAPVDFLPQDLTVYSPGSAVYGSGKMVAPGTYVVVDVSNGGAPAVTGLTPGHTYYATVFDMNGYNAPVYLRPGSSVAINIPNEPTKAAANPSFSSIEGNTMMFSWANGDGGRRIVVARKGTPVTTIPQDGAVYTAATNFGSGAELTPGSGEFVIYDGTYNSTTITGLEKATTWYFSVFEYNSSSTGPDYLTAAGKWLTASRSTLSAPSAQVANVGAYNIQPTEATIGFTMGSGSSRVFLMHEGAPVDVEPADYTSYMVNSNFRTPLTQIGNGNYAVSNANAAFTVTNLKPGTQYYITAFEFNGNSGPVYAKPGAAMYSFTTTGTLPLQWLSFTAREKEGMVLLEWTTAQEVNTGYFEVQRSADGKNFTTIASVNASATPAINLYSYNDATAQSGINYYRIKQVDIDGQFTFSKTVQVKFATEEKVVLLQNPAGNELRLKCSPQQVGGILLITDAGGRLVQKARLTTGLPVVYTGDLKHGIYYVSIANKSGKVVTTIPFVH